MSSIFQPHVPRSERTQNKYFEAWDYFLQKCVLFKFLFVSVSSRRAWLTTTAAEADVSGGETSHRDNNVPGTLTRIRDQGPRTRDQALVGPGTWDQWQTNMLVLGPGIFQAGTPKTWTRLTIAIVLEPINIAGGDIYWKPDATFTFDSAAQACCEFLKDLQRSDLQNVMIKFGGKMFQRKILSV